MNTVYRELHIDQLVPHPQNIRKAVGDVVGLANSITTNGIISPLLVTPHPEHPEEKYLIIAGHTRRDAAALANVDSVPCIVDDSLDTLDKQLAKMLVENTQRTDLTVTEEAEAYQALLEFPGYNIKTVAKATGRSQSLVRSRIALTKLSDDAKGKIEDRTLNIEQALVLVDFTDDEAATKRLLRVADKPNDWALQLANENKRKAWLENLPRLTAELQGAGVEIVERPDGPTWQWTDWRVAYTEMTVAEAVADGWSAICDETVPDITWLKKRPKNVQVTPQRTPEEIAAQVRVSEINRGLTVAAEVRTAFVKNLIQKPAPDKARDMLVEYVLERHDLADLGKWLDIDHEEIDEQEVIDAVGQLNIPQLVTQMHVDQFEREMHMSELSGWANAQGYWSTKSWRERLETVHGYQWTEAEQAAIDYHKPAEEGSDDE